MKKVDAAKLAAGPRLELDLSEVEIVRLFGHHGAIPDSAHTATFVATFKLILTEVGYVRLRDSEPVKSSGKPSVVLIEVRNDGNVVCPLEGNLPQDELAEFLRENFDFEWELNGHTVNLPRVENADSITDKALLQHPWVCILEPAGIRTQLFELDCHVKPRRPVERQEEPGKRRIASALLRTYLEIDDDIDDAELEGTTFRVPVVVDNLDRDAFLVFELEPRTKQYLVASPQPAGSTPDPAPDPALDAAPDPDAEVAASPRRRTRGSSPPNNGRTAQ